MKTIKFYKYHGTGNDFILIDNRDQKIVFPSSGNIADLCNRRFGIGADGLILLEESGSFDFRMIYFNADGREGSMCGNGGRCIVAFAAYLGLIGRKTSFEAVDGIHDAEIIERNDQTAVVSLKMQDVSKIERYGQHYILDTGSPHYVVCRNELNGIDVVEEGRKIRYSDRFHEKGINVNFISGKSGKLEIKTYERGVEDETWSCGTGSVAAAIVLELEGETIPGEPVEIRTRGGNLKVDYIRNDESFTGIHLTGPAVRVFEGITNKLF